MVDEQDPKLLEFRIKRIRRAPRNWTYWISVFTAVNALLIWLGEDTVILAGLVAPFMASGPLPHVIMALLFLALARFSERFPQLLIVGFSLYVIDSVVAAYHKFWSGVVMHVIVISLVFVSLVGARALSRAATKRPGETEA